MNSLPQDVQNRIQRLARKAKRAIRPANRRRGAKGLHVLGPYRNRDTWRVVLVEGAVRKSICVASHDEAVALAAHCKQEALRTQNQTISESLQDYRTYLLSVRQVLPSTAEHVYTSLAGWLPVTMPVRLLTAAKAQHLYEELTQTIGPRTGRLLSVATHQFFLTNAKSWGGWLCKERLSAINPFADVAPRGKKHCGKTQLRIDEAKQLVDRTQPSADAGDTDALAILLMLHLGLRQGEVGARIARDVDDEGSLLWITSGKTANAARRLEVPDCLRAPLLALARRKQPGELLFTEGHKIPSRQHFWGQLHRFCRLAQVPLVCPHALRGLHASLALEAGATGRLVAQALGHGSFQITARHYATAESITASRAARVSEALGTKDDAVSRLLAELSPAQREELKKRLG